MKLLNGAAPEADNGIKVGISLHSGQPQSSAHRLPGCVPILTPGGHKLLRKIQRSPHSLARFLGQYTTPRLSGGSLPKGRGAGPAVGAPGLLTGRVKGPETPTVTPVPGGAREPPLAMHAPAGRISHIAGQLNQTLSP